MVLTVRSRVANVGCISRTESIELAPRPPPLPSPSCHSFLVFMCVPMVELSARRGRERGWARSQFIGPQESLVIYKSHNTLCTRLTTTSEQNANRALTSCQQDALKSQQDTQTVEIERILISVKNNIETSGEQNAHYLSTVERLYRGGPC
jgi:hypothetical protein